MADEMTETPIQLNMTALEDDDCLVDGLGLTLARTRVGQITPISHVAESLTAALV